MYLPECLSRSFVNKQNIRSFSNIVPIRILKKENKTLFMHAVFGEELVSVVSLELQLTLETLKVNLVEKSKDDFKSFFKTNSTAKNPNLTPVNKNEVLSGCWKAIHSILPREFYGSNHNFKIFQRFINSIIYSMKEEHIDVYEVINKWDVTKSPWNHPDVAHKVLFSVIMWMANKVLAAIICLNFYVTTSKIDSNDYKLFFFWKNEWQSFYDKKISQMIKTKVIKKNELMCSLKKVRKYQNAEEKRRLKNLKSNIPKLHLILKPNNEYRPIVKYRADIQTLSEKKRMKQRLNILKKLLKAHVKLELKFSYFHQQWTKISCPRLYFLKTDLSNAFGNIDTEKLMLILHERHLQVQKAESNIRIKKKIAQDFHDLVSELRKPLFIRAGSTVFEWKHGLVQGYKYSPALSELYYQYMDEKIFAGLAKPMENALQLFIRVVDDYLFITNDLSDALTFLDRISIYNNVNYNKTVVNFPHSSIKCSAHITFVGYCYNTSNLEISRADNVFSGEMCYKIAFTKSISNISKFLENRIGQSGIQINEHIFNFNYNNKILIWNHIFTTLCLSANKFCTILAILCDPYDMHKYLLIYKRKVVVNLCNSILDMLFRNKPNDFIFMYCINHFHYVAWKALVLCSNHTPKCNVLVPLVNAELAKSNCLFGKWRKHASEIDRHGVIRKESVKEVCRRTDLRVILKNIDKLPRNFKPYNRESRL